MKLIEPSAKRLIVSIAIISGLVACANTSIKSPDQLVNAQALLVLPVHEINEAHLKQHGFYYFYEIVNIDSFDTTHRAVFKLPIKENMLIVDSLPPGNYAVRQFVFKTIGTGDFTYGENIEERDDLFKLETGKITIFHQSLNVRLYNKTPGRGMTTSYQFGMNPLTQTQMQGIIGTLGALQYLNHWDISSSEGPVTASSKKVGEPVAQPGPKPTAFDVTGTYTSSITGNTSALKIQGASPEVKLVQNGTEIIGAFGGIEQNIWGNIDGRTIKFEWYSPSGATGATGRGTWVFKSDGSGAEGKWDHGHSYGSEGKWDLSKTGQPVSVNVSPVELPVEFDLTGIYTSEILRKNDSIYWCFNQKRKFKIMLKQENNRINGTFLSGITGGITGKINKNKVVFTWYTSRCSAGNEGEWIVDSSGSSLQGFGGSELDWQAQKNN